MDKYTAWSFCYSKRHYLTHPWKWFGSLIRNIKDVCMRARYGFTWSDVWNFDQWFLHVAPNMLRHMAAKGSAYPGRPPFETPEKWRDWLNEMAHLLETGTEDWQNDHNEYYEAYMKDIMANWDSNKKDEIRKKYFEEMKFYK